MCMDDPLTHQMHKLIANNLHQNICHSCANAIQKHSYHSPHSICISRGANALYYNHHPLANLTQFNRRSVNDVFREREGHELNALHGWSKSNCNYNAMNINKRVQSEEQERESEPSSSFVFRFCFFGICHFKFTQPQCYWNIYSDSIPTFSESPNVQIRRAAVLNHVFL